MKNKIWKRYTTGRKHGGQRYWINPDKHKNRFRRKPAINISKQRRLAKEYMNMPMHNVKITNNTFSGTYGNTKLRYHYVKPKHVNTIGIWDHKMNKNNIRIDADVKRKNIQPLLVHEAVEQYLEKHKGLPYSTAHKLATSTEKQFIKDKGKNWRNYQISVMKTRT